MGKRILFFISGIFCLGIVLGIWIAQNFQNTSLPPKKTSEDLEVTASGNVSGTSHERGFVSRVIDGDTVVLKDGRKIRYIGIDTPETVDPQKPTGCFGVEATQKNRELVLNQEVDLEKDISETDKFGRILRYVYVSSTNGKVMVNEVLVRDGFALSSSFPPDVKYQDNFVEAQRLAKLSNKGLWGGCQSEQSGQEGPATATGAEKYENRSENDSLTSASGCVIKGNISTSREKIYHIPGCGSYEKTVVDKSAGEHWFCSEDEAVKAGWRKAKNC